MTQNIHNKEHLKFKYQTDMDDLQTEEDSIIQKEVPMLQEDNSFLQNKYLDMQERNSLNLFY